MPAIYQDNISEILRPTATSGGGNGSSGGGSMPGGNTGQVQFNNSGAFGGIPGTQYNVQTGDLLLGTISNVQITGGAAGQFVSTDGQGNLSFATPPQPQPIIQPAIDFDVVANGNNQTFSSALLANFPSANYATVFRNGILVEEVDYTIASSVLTMNVFLYAGDRIHVAAVGGSSVTTAAGPNNSIQFNNGGAAAGSANLKWDGANIFVYGNIVPVTYDTSATNQEYRSWVARGNVSSPSPVLAGDYALQIGSGVYTGNGASTVDGVAGWSAFNAIAVRVAAQPTADTFRPAANLELRSMGNANVVNVTTFDSTGNLTVPSNIKAAQFRSTVTNDFSAGYTSFVYSNTGIASTSFDLVGVSARGTSAAPLPTQSGDFTFSLAGFGYSGNGTSTVGDLANCTFTGGIAHQIVALPTGANSYYSTNLYFSTTNAISNTLSAMTYDSSGNLTVPGAINGGSTLSVPTNITTAQFRSTSNVANTTNFIAKTVNNTLTIGNVGSDFVGVVARGDIGNLQPIGVGDQILSVAGWGYSGNGTITVGDTPNVALGAVINSVVTGLPTTANGCYDTRISLAAGNSSSNTFVTCTLNSSGNLLLDTGGFFVGNVLATSAPSTSSSAGVAGQIAYANGFVYVCVAANTWQRAALSTF